MLLFVGCESEAWRSQGLDCSCKSIKWSQDMNFNMSNSTLKKVINSIICISADLRWVRKESSRYQFYSPSRNFRISKTQLGVMAHNYNPTKGG